MSPLLVKGCLICASQKGFSVEVVWGFGRYLKMPCTHLLSIANTLQIFQKVESPLILATLLGQVLPHTPQKKHWLLHKYLRTKCILKQDTNHRKKKKSHQPRQVSLPVLLDQAWQLPRISTTGNTFEAMPGKSHWSHGWISTKTGSEAS